MILEFLREKIEFKRIILEGGIEVSTTGLRENGSRRWAGAERGDK
jgi:hypothetical protein